MIAFNAIATEKAPETARWPGDYDADEQAAIRDCMRAALATQPDRYAQGFEKAREMAARLVEVQIYRSDFHFGMDGAEKSMAKKIRNMEMPDETSDNR